MALANLGSIADRIQNRIGPLPTGISGTECYAIIYEKVIDMEDFTKLSIGSVAIAERFQPALINLSIAEILRSKDGQDGNMNQYNLHEFSITKSFGDDSLAAAFEKKGQKQLKRIGRGQPFYQAYG